MLTPRTSDTLHRVWLLRLLSAIVDDRLLASVLHFKGGTCAAMRDLLDRFSVDLDFDLGDTNRMPEVRKHLETIFTTLRLDIKDASVNVPQYFLRYPSESGARNTIALDITTLTPQANAYETVHLPDIDRIVSCQTVPTMVAHKLVTPLDRFQLHGSIAGRDFYDIHRFLLQDLPWNRAVIEERTGKTIEQFLPDLIDFIEKKVTQTIIDQDINLLLPAQTFQTVRHQLKTETLALLRLRYETSPENPL